MNLSKVVLPITLSALLLVGCQSGSATVSSSASFQTAAEATPVPSSPPSSVSDSGGSQTTSAVSSAPKDNLSEDESSSADNENWTQQAQTFTTQIVESSLQAFDESAGITSLNDEEIFYFISTMKQYYTVPSFPYGDKIVITEPTSSDPNLVAHVSEKDAKTIASQLFGRENWSYDAPDCYDRTLAEYHFNLEAGAHYSPYSCQNIKSEISDNTVIVSFRLTASLRFVGETETQTDEFGNYQAIYRVVSDDKGSFLRLESILPA